MFPARLLLCFALTFGLPGSVASQSVAPTPQRDPVALSLLQNSIAAMGGASAVAKITDTIVTGSVQPAPGSSAKAGTFTWETSGSDFKYQLQAASLAQTFVSGHGSPATVRNGVVAALPPHIALANPPIHLPVLVLSGILADDRYSVTFVGNVSLNDAPAVKVHISLDTDLLTAVVTPQDWYFDALSGLPLRVEHRLPDNRRPENYVPVAEEFSDFRVVSGLLVPFRITSYENGALVAVETVTAVSFNNGLSPSEFDAPTGGVQ